jgi:hypothetical protein
MRSSTVSSAEAVSLPSNRSSCDAQHLAGYITRVASTMQQRSALCLIGQWQCGHACNTLYVPLSLCDPAAVSRLAVFLQAL